MDESSHLISSVDWNADGVIRCKCGNWARSITESDVTHLDAWLEHKRDAMETAFLVEAKAEYLASDRLAAAIREVDDQIANGGFEP